MSDRQIDAFFYGLFMDLDVLQKSGVEPTNIRRASVPNFALRIGQRATLISSAGARAYGMLMSLSHEELDNIRKLFWCKRWTALPQRLCVTTLSKHQDQTSGIPNTLSDFRESCASWTSRLST